MQPTFTAMRAAAIPLLLIWQCPGPKHSAERSSRVSGVVELNATRIAIDGEDRARLPDSCQRRSRMPVGSKNLLHAWELAFDLSVAHGRSDALHLFCATSLHQSSPHADAAPIPCFPTRDVIFCANLSRFDQGQAVSIKLWSKAPAFLVLRRRIDVVRRVFARLSVTSNSTALENLIIEKFIYPKSKISRAAD